MYIYTLRGIMVNLPQYSWNQKCNLKLLGTMQNLWQGPGLFITLVSSYLAEVRDQGQGATARTPQHRTIMKDDGLLGFSGILPISSLIQGGKSSHIFCAVSKNCHDLVACGQEGLLLFSIHLIHTNFSMGGIHPSRVVPALNMAKTYTGSTAVISPHLSAWIFTFLKEV